MAPHDTNTPKEARRHAVPLIGMALVVVFGVGIILWWLAGAIEPESPPDVNLQPTAPASAE